MPRAFTGSGMAPWGPQMPVARSRREYEGGAEFSNRGPIPLLSFRIADVDLSSGSPTLTQTHILAGQVWRQTRSYEMTGMLPLLREHTVLKSATSTSTARLPKDRLEFCGL